MNLPFVYYVLFKYNLNFANILMLIPSKLIYANGKKTYNTVLLKYTAMEIQNL